MLKLEYITQTHHPLKMNLKECQELLYLSLVGCYTGMDGWMGMFYISKYICHIPIKSLSCTLKVCALICFYCIMLALNF